MTDRYIPLQTGDSERFDFADRESAILAEIDVARRLGFLMSELPGRRSFAEAFYFVRVGFVRANFALGARCPLHEEYWGPIARNLWEELGGGASATHNELYRRFLRSLDLDEGALTAPAFALEFDRRWMAWVQEAPLLDGLAALAIYESLDAPDYQTLFEVLQSEAGSGADLEFFVVHAESRHVELFGELAGLADADELQEAIERAGDFVFSAQTFMWKGLLSHLEAAR